MKGIRRIISFLLALVMVIGMVPPMAVSAEETEPAQAVTEAVEEASSSTETVTESAEEITAPTESAADPMEETTVATEAETEPAEETTVPKEAETEHAEETTVLTEAVAEISAPTESAAESEEAEIPEPVLTYRRLICSEDGIWGLEDWEETANEGLYGEDELTFAPGEYWLAFYLNTWDPESGSWEHTPVHVEFGEYLNVELMKEKKYCFASDVEDAGYYYHIVTTETANDLMTTVAFLYKGERLIRNLYIALKPAREDWEIIDNIIVQANVTLGVLKTTGIEVLNPRGKSGLDIAQKAREWMDKTPKPLRYDGDDFDSRTGFTSPPSFDCSGFVFRVCYDLGLTSTHKPEYDRAMQDSYGNYYITSHTYNQKLYGDSLATAVDDYKKSGDISGFCAGDLLFF